MSHARCNRRQLLRSAVVTVAGTAALSRGAQGQPRSSMTRRGLVTGEPTAERVADEIFAAGGNAVDAVVAAALAAAIAAPHQTGIGGYGGCATLAIAGRPDVVSLDFNSAAPERFTSDVFQAGADGKSRHSPKHGWMAAGVPGVLAGLQLLLSRFGTFPFRDVVAPAIRLAREGIPIDRGLASALQTSRAQLTADPGSKKLYFHGDDMPRVGQVVRNPDLAEMLATLAQRNSVESFYHGDIAGEIARTFQNNDGLVTTRDLATYRARETPPLSWVSGDFAIHTAPLTAGGLTVLQVFHILSALSWDNVPPGPHRTHLQFEALRMAWHERLVSLGDPNFITDPTDRLLSTEHARRCSEKIQTAVEEGKILSHPVTPRAQSGTIHLSGADRDGNFIAITFTHGDSFGARVTVEGLGLTLGHGMSRFETDPGHPNAPGPGKRPLHNMCPTIVTRRGRPIVAVGARGGRRIPNALFEVLSQLVLFGRTLSDAVAAPRVHTEGDDSFVVEKTWSTDQLQALQQLGYKISNGNSATVSAVASMDGELTGAMR